MHASTQSKRILQALDIFLPQLLLFVQMNSARASRTLLSASTNLFQKLALDLPENEPVMSAPDRECSPSKAPTRFFPKPPYALSKEICLYSYILGSCASYSYLTK